MSPVPDGCKVCAAWHANGKGDECHHWCHFAGAEDWDAPVRGEDGRDGE